jgi:PPM family protein phosphatase
MILTTPRSRMADDAAGPGLMTPAALSGSAGARAAWRGGLEYGAASRWGSHHPENEDSYLLPTGSGMPIAVADGVGGGARGKVASQVMTTRIKLLTPALLADPRQLRTWLLASDDTVAAEIARRADRPGATTFVAAVPSRHGRRWAVTWAGDCRAYRLTAANVLQCLTRDDTYGNLAEIPPAGASPDDPARMVGNGAVDQANLRAIALAEGEILFLCSDGVHRFVPGEQIVAIMRAAGGLDQCCRRLTAAAHLNGGHDDATVVAVERHRWFGVSHAPRWLMLAGLAISVTLPAWQYFAHNSPMRPEPVEIGPTHAVPAAQAQKDAPVAAAVPVPSPDGLRLIPSRALSGGLQPADVAAPIKDPAAARHKPAQLRNPESMRSTKPAKQLETSPAVENQE